MVRIISLDHLEDYLGRDEVADGLFYSEQPVSYPRRRRRKIERSEPEPVPSEVIQKVNVGRSLLHPRE